MARPLVHRMVHQQDRPGFQGGSEWACPFCPHQVVYWPVYYKVMVTGQAEVLHVRAMTEVPVHLDDLVVELTEADENWLTRQRHRLVGRGDSMTSRAPRRSRARTVSAAPCWAHEPFVGGSPSARQGIP
jgi:hypothetical protein